MAQVGVSSQRSSAFPRMVPPVSTQPQPLRRSAGGSFLRQTPVRRRDEAIRRPRHAVPSGVMDEPALVSVLIHESDRATLCVIHQLARIRFCPGDPPGPGASVGGSIRVAHTNLCLTSNRAWFHSWDHDQPALPPDPRVASRPSAGSIGNTGLAEPLASARPGLFQSQRRAIPLEFFSQTCTFPLTLVR